MIKSVEELAEMSIDQLINFLADKGKNRFDDPQAVALSLQKAARSSYRLPKSMADSVNLAMASSIRVIRAIQDELKSLRKAIEDHLKTIPQTLDSVPGIGPIFAAGILAEIGDIRSLVVINNWPSSPVLRGPRTSLAILQLLRPGLFIRATAI